MMDPFQFENFNGILIESNRVLHYIGPSAVGR